MVRGDGGWQILHLSLKDRKPGPRFAALFGMTKPNWFLSQASDVPSQLNVLFVRVRTKSNLLVSRKKKHTLEILLSNFACHPDLVGGLVAMFYFPIYWVANHPNWRPHIFQTGGPTTNQFWRLQSFSLQLCWLRALQWQTIAFQSLSGVSECTTLFRCAVSCHAIQSRYNII